MVRSQILSVWIRCRTVAQLPGLLDADRKKAIIAELLETQQTEGGWSLSSLSGDWKRADGTPQETKSDGYATGAA